MIPPARHLNSTNFLSNFLIIFPFPPAPVAKKSTELIAYNSFAYFTIPSICTSTLLLFFSASKRNTNWGRLKTFDEIHYHRLDKWRARFTMICGLAGRRARSGKISRCWLHTFLFSYSLWGRVERSFVKRSFKSIVEHSSVRSSNLREMPFGAVSLSIHTRERVATIVRHMAIYIMLRYLPNKYMHSNSS